MKTMTLLEFLRHMSAEQREPFAKSCDTSLGHLRNVAYGYRPCAAELAVLIEDVSGRQVTRQELCPDNWWRIWPELFNACSSNPNTAPNGQGVADA